MAENRIDGKEPLWLLIEKEIVKEEEESFAEQSILDTTQKIAEELDASGYNVSKSGGNWLRLKDAVKTRTQADRPFMEDLDKAISVLTLDDLSDTQSVAMKIVAELGKDWSGILTSENIPDFEKMVVDKKTDLVIAKAKELSGEDGIRYLIAESFEAESIVEIMGISEDDFNSVKTKVDAEIAEKKRVQELYEKAPDSADDEKIKYLVDNDASDELIIEIGGFTQSAIDDVKKKMEKELEEKRKKEEELAAKKAAEAAGPSLDQIEPDQMLEYIEGIREILEFSDQEKDIRIMCEQSSIPQALVDIAVNDPDKLDEMEAEAEG
ncbi:hypothetical protein ACFL6W_07355 [Thermodesulfobacteriota bacterium]